MHPRYDFTTDWFTAAQPSWHRLLDPLAGAPRLRFAEVGVFEGRSTVGHRGHLMSAAGQEAGEDLPEVLLVLRDQDANAPLIGHRRLWRGGKSR